MIDRAIRTNTAGEPTMGRPSGTGELHTSGQPSNRRTIMNLEATLAATREASAKRIPPALQTIMHDATVRLRGSGILDRVIKPGAKVSDFALNDQNGQMVVLSALLSAGPVVVGIFRGFW